MTRRPRSTITLLTACLALLVAGCGEVGSVAQIKGAQSASISRGTLDHWMRAMAGGDFRQSIGVEGPAGLASEPANPARCFAAAKLVGPRSFFNQLRLAPQQVERTCRELHSAIKAQALSYLISVQWILAEGARRGITITDAKLRRAFSERRAQLYPTEHDLHDYLRERQWSLADLLDRLKAELIAATIAPPSATQLNALANGEQTQATLAVARDRNLMQETKCAAGYVVSGCNAYRSPLTSSPAPDTILRKLVGRPS